MPCNVAFLLLAAACCAMNEKAVNVFFAAVGVPRISPLLVFTNFAIKRAKTIRRRRLLFSPTTSTLRVLPFVNPYNESIFSIWRRCSKFTR